MLTLAASAASLVACGADTTQSQAATSQDDTGAAAAAPGILESPAAATIAWFDGGVEEAFAEARDVGKPLFLYWGAEWCPPCHLVKATVFRSPEFIERSRLFVPVYLDGDTDDAQQTGERFGVLGYPTMIVFTPEGEEITRIPGGSDIQAYADILDLTLSNTDAAGTLVARILDGEGGLAGRDCQLLAYYSWGQDTSILAGVDQVDAFRAMYDACPADERQARSVLFLSHLDAALDAADEDESPRPLDEAQKNEALERVVEMLTDPTLMRVNLYTLLFDGARITSALTESGDPARDSLRKTWENVLDAVAADEDLFQTERLYAQVGKLEFERMEDPEAPLSDGLREEILAAVQWADEVTTDGYERQSVINTARNVLMEAGLTEEAARLLYKELEISKQPYYFMVGLARIEQQNGNYADAIGWLKRAYDEAQGPATRFQWGAYYVHGLIDMVPQESERIEQAALDLIAELGETQAFYQRPKRQLVRLERKLRAWNEAGERDASIDSIRAGVLAICGRIPETESARETCESFLST